MLDYFRRDDHTGGLAMPGLDFYRSDGKLHTFDDVSLGVLLEVVESHISRLKPEDKRTEIFQKVMAGIPGRKELPKWEPPPPFNPNGTPRTRFSMSRAVRRPVFPLDCGDNGHVQC